MTRPTISEISPFFIVADVTATLSFYRDMLGFEVDWQIYGASRDCWKKLSTSVVAVKKKLRRLSSVGSNYPY